jgi:hypothetical protein
VKRQPVNHEIIFSSKDYAERISQHNPCQKRESFSVKVKSGRVISSGVNCGGNLRVCHMDEGSHISLMDFNKESQPDKEK